MYAIGLTYEDRLELYGNASKEDGIVYTTPSSEEDYFEKIQVAVEDNIDDFLKRNIKVINSSTSPIEKNEFRFCMRTGSGLIQYNGQLRVFYDYHFMVQTRTGQWAHKQGWYNAAENLGYIDPEDYDWDLEGIEGFYDSDIIYFACTR